MSLHLFPSQQCQKNNSKSSWTVKADAGLQEKLKSDNDADAVVATAKSAGFAISAEELKKFQVEITDEELESVAGGEIIFDLAKDAAYYLVSPFLPRC